jgi:hypothetical protein
MTDGRNAAVIPFVIEEEQPGLECQRGPENPAARLHLAEPRAWPKPSSSPPPSR